MVSEHTRPVPAPVRIGDRVAWSGREALVVDMRNGFPARELLLRWTHDGTPGAADEVSESRWVSATAVETLKEDQYRAP